MRVALLLSLTVALSASAEVSPSKVMAGSEEKLSPNVDLSPFAGPEAEADKTLAPYFAAPNSDQVLESMPLKSTTTSVTVSGVIAHIRIRQLFENTGSKPIEAVYVFPASTRAAVHGMRMKIGERTIEAKIEKRETARKQFEKAREEGKRAGLLEQQRPNVFTTSVTNLMPKDRVEVELEYSELLVPEENVYELVVPAVVGPRYGGGADPQGDRWIANPYLHAGEKEPYAFDVDVQLDTALPLRDLNSPSHEVDVNYASSSSAKVTLKKKEGAGTRDFVLRYRLAGDQIEAGVLVGRDGEQGFFTVMLQPPARPTVEQIVPREYIFVLDVSGSMMGFPLDTAKALMRNLLGQLRPTDHFNIVLFAGAAAVMSEKSIDASTSNVQSAIAFVDGQRGGGGTELLGGLERAYAIPPVSDKVSRNIVVVTDGYVGVEGKAFKLVREHLDQANVFAFGIGSSVNRGLIEALARAGEGEPYVVLDASKAEAKANQLRHAIEQPVLTNIQVRYKGFDAFEVAPMKIPGLMARRPLVLFGKFRGEATGQIEVTGDSAGKPYRQTLDVASNVRPANALQWLWARRWVETLEDQFHLTGADEVKAAITDLGLSYRLLTPFTSFIAVDSEVVNKGGKASEVKQPLPMPQGVPDTAVGGLGSSGYGASLGALGGGMGMGGRGVGAGGGGYGMGMGSVELKGLGGGDEGKMGKFEKKDAHGGTSNGVAPGTVTVNGSLSKELIQRVARQHQNELRYCYESELQKTPTLSGKIAVSFTIDPLGNVIEAHVTSSSLKNKTMEGCVITRLQRWKFPALGGTANAIVATSWVFQQPAKAE